MNNGYVYIIIPLCILLVGGAPIWWKKLRVARGKRRSGRR